MTAVPDPAFTPDVPRSEGRSPLSLALARLRRDRGAMVSLGVIVSLIVVAIAAPIFTLVTGHGPNDMYYTPDARSPLGLPVGPNSSFWLGTDQAGRDVLVRVVYGARISLAIGLGATAMSIVLGVTLGLFAGYFRGVIDIIISRIIDTALAIPFLLFGVALVSVVGQINIFQIMGVIAMFGWASVARIIRGQVISLREKEFVEASRSLGAGDMRIIFVDVLPNVIAPAIVFATLLIPTAVLTGAALSFLGIGVQPPTADWGGMISDASANQLYLHAWWFLLFPGLALLILTISFNILGDGVRDAFDPRGDRLGVRRSRLRRRSRGDGRTPPPLAVSKPSASGAGT
ncbi:ABC transporter permease [Mycolicibacterium sp. P9-64]|uniref:ABC transporter permease n=1 Tax=Mycolicibacterium sp. P9-64 TaxID=2024612 RepID=UPI0018D5C649|nr:ABC transporter permease [Mycolicibacterium sp. P9-64]